LGKSCIFVSIYLYFLIIFYPMVKMKEGFKGERFASLPDNLLETYSKDPLIGDLFLRKIGYFPRVKYHYIQKEHGCDYTMLIYCTDGEGWYEIYGEKHILRKNEYIILPQNTPYAFGANNENPWTIYWLHFKGKNCKYYQPGSCVPRSITPDNHSRLQDRLLLFEEIYHCFSLAYIPEYMRYTSACLHLFLSSFIYLEQYRSIQTFINKDLSFSGKVIHFMQENLQYNITLEELAAHFKYSASHFSMLFQKETGSSPINYFLRLKIQKACQYIELTDLKLQDIATAIGFEEPAYFSRLFTKIMGMTPSAYRKQEKG
jgi:AraC-like DNA-binding protein